MREKPRSGEGPSGADGGSRTPLREWTPAIAGAVVGVIALAAFAGALDLLKTTPGEEPPPQAPDASPAPGEAESTEPAGPSDGEAGSGDPVSGPTPTEGSPIDPSGSGAVAIDPSTAIMPDPAAPTRPSPGSSPPAPGTVASQGGSHSDPLAEVRRADYDANVASVVLHVQGILDRFSVSGQGVIAGDLPPETVRAMVAADRLQLQATRTLTATIEPPPGQAERHAALLSSIDSLIAAYGPLQECVSRSGGNACPEALMNLEIGRDGIARAAATTPAG